MERPTTTSDYTKQDLRDYALYRKDREFSRIEALQEIEDCEEQENSDYYREPLDVCLQKVLKIQLSWGGDGDGYKLTFNKGNELSHGVYYWEDWGVYEEIDLTDEEAQQISDLYLCGDPSSFLNS